jgi:hypothetical protein
MHKGTRHDTSVLGQAVTTILDNNMDKCIQCDKLFSGLAKK